MNKFTLFLDRDGVINRRIPGSYITRWEDFEFLPGVLTALQILNPLVGRIVIATNQQGIRKGIFDEAALEQVHQKMLERIHEAGGRIDKVYYCPELAITNPRCRKPNPGMAEQAQADFSEIKFHESIMAGDSASDIQFANQLGMKSARIYTRDDEEEKLKMLKIDYYFNSLLGLANFIYSNSK